MLKQGHRTSEFVVTVLLAVGALAAALAGQLAPRYAAIASAVSVAAYSISRGLAKQSALLVSAADPAAPPPPTTTTG